MGSAFRRTNPAKAGSDDTGEDGIDTLGARVLTADRGDAGVRLDLVLRRHLADVDAATRTQVQLWIENGHVTVNDVPVHRTAARAAAGDVVTVMLPATPPRAAMAAENVALDIL